MDQGNKARRIKRNYYDKEIMKTSFAVALPCALVLSFAAGLVRFASTQQAPVMQWAGTFHGIGARLLREYASTIGLAVNFTIQDRSDSEDLMGLVRHDLQLATTKNRFPLKSTCLAIYSRALNSRAPLNELLRDVYPWCAAWEDELRRLFRAYVAEKQNQCVLDYDDLLLYWSQMLAEPELARHVAARFDHVLVDEYQDTNLLQARILRGMCSHHRKLTVCFFQAASCQR